MHFAVCSEFITIWQSECLFTAKSSAAVFQLPPKRVYRAFGNAQNRGYFQPVVFVYNRFVSGLQYPPQIVCSGLAVPFYKARGITFPYAFLRVDVRVYLPDAVVPVDGDGLPLREIP